MKVQLRRWFAIGLTSGALAVSMLAGSGAVGAANENAQNAKDNFYQPGIVLNATAPTADSTAIIIPSNATVSMMDPTYFDNR